MERQTKTIYIDCHKKKINNLNYKKIIYQRKQIKNNSHSIKNKQNYRKNIKMNSLSHLTKINSFDSKNSKKIKNNDKITNLKLNTTKSPNKKIYKKIILPYINLNSVNLIQKLIRGFLARKKFKKFYKSYKNEKILAFTENIKHSQRKIDITIFDAIKRNSKNQKKSIKLANNRLNLVISDSQAINKNNIILINKKITKHNSFDNNKKEDNKNNKNNKKYLEDNLSNVDNCCTNNKNINLNTDNKIQNQSFISETEFSMSDFLNEQSPQNIVSNSDNKKENNILNNLNLKKELSNLKTLSQVKGNICKIKDITTNNLFNKNNENLNSPEIKNTYQISSIQTKENSSSDRNIIQRNTNFLLDSENNKNNQNDIELVNTKININKNKIVSDIKNEKKENNNSKSDIDLYLKDEFETDILYKQNKKNFNLIATNIKYNFNPMINSKINNFENLNNQKKTINNNYYLEKLAKDLNNFNKEKKKFESLIEEKQNDIGNNKISLKSSFYDEEEFVIISYDYSLNDKKTDSQLKITNTEAINFKGKQAKKPIYLIIAIKKIIYKRIYLYVFNFLKQFKNENDDKKDNENDKSMTDNESATYIPFGRIEKNKIIFDYAQNDMKYKNNKIYK